MDTDLGLLNSESFASAKGSRFTVTDAEVAFELIRIERREASSTARPFSLIFLSKGPIVHEQRTYHLKHAELGTLSIFLVPVARTGQSVEYEAVFN